MQLLNYINTDPVFTYDVLQKILKDYNTHITNINYIDKIVKLIYPHCLDLFTSPPYFNGPYNDEPEQSSIKFSTSDNVKEKFLKQTIANACELKRE